MAAERHAPDAILAATEQSGAVTVIDEDPDSSGTDFLTASGNNVNTDCRVSFPTPTANPTVGADLQEFKIQVREFNTGQTGTPEARIELWESGSLVRAGSNVDVTTQDQVLSFLWNANELATADGSLVEAKFVGTKSGGSPSARNTTELGAIEWNADVTGVAAGGDGDATAALAALGLASTADYIAPSSAAMTAALAVLGIASTADYIAPSSAAATAALAALGASASGVYTVPAGGDGDAIAGLASLGITAPDADYQPGERFAGLVSIFAALGLSAIADYIEPSTASAAAGLSSLAFSATGVEVEAGAPGWVFRGSRAITIGIRI